MRHEREALVATGAGVGERRGRRAAVAVCNDSTLTPCVRGEPRVRAAGVTRA
jgi:hypothetical protein